MKRKCDICGELHNEFDMVTFNPGRVKWVCWECYKNSQYEATQSEMRRAKDLHRQLGQKRSMNDGETRFRNRQ